MGKTNTCTRPWFSTANNLRATHKEAVWDIILVITTFLLLSQPCAPRLVLVELGLDALAEAGLVLVLVIVRVLLVRFMRM